MSFTSKRRVGPVAQSIANAESMTRLGEDLRRELTAKMANRLLEIAQEECPVDTGWLQTSLNIDMSPSGFMARLEALAYYAEWVEFGSTRRNGSVVPPNPFMRRSLDRLAQEFPAIASTINIARPSESAASYMSTSPIG